MIGDFLRRLSSASQSHDLSQGDSRLALAVLMVRVARTDGNYTGSERRLIDQALAGRYGFDAASAAALRTEAEAEEESAPDTVRFTRLIKDAVPYEERSGVVEALWRVAADDGINADEHGLMRLVANLLGVADQDNALARQRALRGG